MSQFDPDKLKVEYRDGVTATAPVIPRRYTLTHSDVTAELFLTIGEDYAYDLINVMRDQVLGEWIQNSGEYLYHVYLDVDGQSSPTATAIRDAIFRRELPLALEAIRYGDRAFFEAHPELDQVPIFVHFMSSDPQYNQIEDWGNFSDYNLGTSDNRENTLLDIKYGDVNGDGVPDQVSLYGNKVQGSSFADNIRMVIQDGQTDQTTTVSPTSNAGYNTRLFLGDFTGNRIDDIKVSIDSGGSGGFGFFYLYSFAHNNLEEIFNYEAYNQAYQYRVDYADFYKVHIANVALNKLFILDISYKGYEYLSQFYDENGKLKQPVQGEVLAISDLIPLVNDEKNTIYDLLAIQRIIGTTNSDSLGYIENLLTWDGQRFISSRMMATIPGTNLIATS